jgi:nucleoside-diphosphate-sugar epimerase
VYNLGHDEVLSLTELAELLIRAGGGGQYRLVPFPADRKAIDIGDYYSDFSRIRDELGWSPTVTLEDGVLRSLDFFRRHRSDYWDDA